MGILDETATEDDYVTPESNPFAPIVDWVTTPIEGWNAPDFVQNQSISNAFGALSDALGDTSEFAFDNMYDLNAMTAGAATWLGAQTADMWSNVFAGEDLSPLDTLEALGVSGVGAAKGAKAVSNAVNSTTELASGMGITRGAMPWHTDKEANEIVGWYDGILGKTKEMGKMVGSMGVQVAKNLYDPKANVLWNKYGISDLEKRELARVIADMESKGGSRRQHYNHIITQMQSNKTLRDKFGNKMPEFLKDMENVLFPKSVNTKGTDLVDSSVPMSTVLPDTGLPPEVIRDHMSAPMVQKLGMDKASNIQLQTKVWESNPVQEIGWKNTAQMDDGNYYIKQHEQPQMKGFKNNEDIELDISMESITTKAGRKKILSKSGRNKLLAQAQKKFIDSENKFPSSTQSAFYLWRTSPEGSKFDLDGFNDLLKSNNTKYLEGSVDGDGLQQGKFMVDPFDLSGEMIDSGDYISFGGKRLGEDKLLGTYDTRLIINKKTGEGYLFIYDEMQLGSPSKTFDRFVLGGNQEQVYVDFFKLKRPAPNKTSGGKSAATLQRGIDSKDLAKDISVNLKEVLDNGVTPQDIAAFKSKRLRQAGAGAAGIGILNYDEN